MAALRKDPEYRVPYDRLRKAAKVLALCPPERTSDMDPKVKSVAKSFGLQICLLPR